MYGMSHVEASQNITKNNKHMIAYLDRAGLQCKFQLEVTRRQTPRSPEAIGGKPLVTFKSSLEPYGKYSDKEN